jgi:hypothetical protein
MGVKNPFSGQANNQSTTPWFGRGWRLLAYWTSGRWDWYNRIMPKSVPAPVLPGQAEYLLPGRNALETSLVLGQSWTREGKPYMLVETVKRVLSTLEQNGIAYAVIDGLAVSHHAVPRLTQDVDVLVRAEDLGRIRSLFPGCYQRGTAVVEIYDIDGTRVDLMPAKLRYQREAVAETVTGEIEGTPARIAAVRDLLLLKMLAVSERPLLGDRKQDEADITRLLEMNKQNIAAGQIRYVGDRMRELAYTAAEQAKISKQLQWLNETLTQLGMADRLYPLPG